MNSLHAPGCTNPSGMLLAVYTEANPRHVWRHCWDCGHPLFVEILDEDHAHSDDCLCEKPWAWPDWFTP